MTLYIAAISALLAWQFNSNRQKDSLFQRASLILSILIKIGGLGWRFLAPFVVSLENHRTLKGYDDAWLYLWTQIFSIWVILVTLIDAWVRWQQDHASISLRMPLH